MISSNDFIAFAHMCYRRQLYHKYTQDQALTCVNYVSNTETIEAPHVEANCLQIVWFGRACCPPLVGRRTSNFSVSCRLLTFSCGPLTNRGQNKLLKDAEVARYALGLVNHSKGSHRLKKVKLCVKHHKK